jgi:phosphoribosylformylglycinamidine synthase
MFKAHIHVTLRPSILDPQGKAVHHALANLGYASVDRVRMGKYAELWIDESDEDAAQKVAEAACEKLLANPVMEDFDVTLERVEPETA